MRQFKREELEKLTPKQLKLRKMGEELWLRKHRLGEEKFLSLSQEEIDNHIKELINYDDLFDELYSDNSDKIALATFDLLLIYTYVLKSKWHRKKHYEKNKKLCYNSKKENKCN